MTNEKREPSNLEIKDSVEKTVGKETIEKIIACDFERVETDLKIAEFLAQTILKGQHKVIGLCGGSGSGKSTIAVELVKLLGEDRAVKINVDGYLKYPRIEMGKLNLTGFDLESRDMERFFQDLHDLKDGKTIQKPIFDEALQVPTNIAEEIAPKDFIILEDTIDFSGIADFTVFTFAPDEVLVQRRLQRDLQESNFWDQETLEKYIREKSLPRYKDKHLRVSAKCDLIINTDAGQIFRKVKKQ